MKTRSKPAAKRPVPAKAKAFKVGTSVKVRVGSHPATRGVVTGRPVTKSNGDWVPVNIAPVGVNPRDIRSYRAAYLTAV